MADNADFEIKFELFIKFSMLNVIRIYSTEDDSYATKKRLSFIMKKKGEFLDFQMMKNKK
jgi:hypothetical protein